MAKDVTVGNSLRNAFGQALISYDYYPFTVFDADVAGGTGLVEFRQRYPRRFVQCGIAEQAMVGMAAGYALEKQRTTFACTFANFGARAWEIFSLSAAYNQAPLVLVLSHLGLDVGPDGASAQSLSHYHLWRSIPGVRVIHPGDAGEMQSAVKYLLDNPQPAVLFTGRSETPDLELLTYTGIPQFIRSSKEATIVACGHTVRLALEAARYLEADHQLQVGVINFSTLAPVDYDAIRVAMDKGPLVTIEDANGGLHDLIGGMVSLMGGQMVNKVEVNDWGQSGESDELYKQYGLTVCQLVDKVLECLNL